MRIILFLILFLSIFSSPVLAFKEFQDDFSSGNLDKWELVNGSMSYWQVSNEAVYATINQSRKLSTLVPKDAFWQGMEEYSVEFIFKVFNGTDKNFVVGMRDAENFYDFHFYNGQLIIEDIRNGFSLHKSTMPFTLEWNRDYQMKINYSKEKIELWVDGEKIFSTSQWWQKPLYGGKFGLKIATGSVAYSAAFFDEVVVRELDMTKMHFFQNDVEWSADIYDHAEEWTQDPAMHHFGCAVTSMAMLLRSYGYRYLPYGTMINPSTLNQWLKEQSDGYVGEGLVNWLAISRLSHILSEQNGGTPPKLEFSYFKGSNLINRLDTLRANLEQTKGQIGTDGKHFFFFDEYLEESDDFSLRDPLYDHLLLSEKTTELESLRLFTPSQTDLSYFLLVLPREMEVTLFDALAAPLDGLQAVIEEIIAPEDEENVIGANYQLWYYQKPDSGDFTFIFDAPAFTASMLEDAQLFFYNQSGEVSQFSMLEMLDPDQDLAQAQKLMVRLSYDKLGQTSSELEIVEESPDDKLRAELQVILSKAQASFDQGLLSFYLFYQLNVLLDSIRNNIQYFSLLGDFMSFHGIQI